MRAVWHTAGRCRRISRYGCGVSAGSLMFRYRPDEDGPMQKEEATVLGGCQIRRGKIWRIAVVFAASGALALSGCASGGEPSGPATDTAAAAAAKVDEIANTVPEEIKSTGKLVVGVNIPYTPNEFKDPSGKIVGFDVDLMNAIAATLGLTAEYREADFAKIIPSIQGGTFNVGMSSFTDTKEREQTVDFVTYFSAGSLWAQRAGRGDRPRATRAARRSPCRPPPPRRPRSCPPGARRAPTRASRRSRSCSSTGRTRPPTPWCSARPTRCRRTRR